MISDRHGLHDQDRCCIHCHMRAVVYTGTPLPPDLSEEDRMARRAVLLTYSDEDKQLATSSWEWLFSDRARARKGAAMLDLMESTGDTW